MSAPPIPSRPPPQHSSSYAPPPPVRRSDLGGGAAGRARAGSDLTHDSRRSSTQSNSTEGAASIKEAILVRFDKHKQKARESLVGAIQGGETGAWWKQPGAGQRPVAGDVNALSEADRQRLNYSPMSTSSVHSFRPLSPAPAPPTRAAPPPPPAPPAPAAGPLDPPGIEFDKIPLYQHHLYYRVPEFQAWLASKNLPNKGKERESPSPEAEEEDALQRVMRQSAKEARMERAAEDELQAALRASASAVASSSCSPPLTPRSKAREDADIERALAESLAANEPPSPASPSRQPIQPRAYGHSTRAMHRPMPRQASDSHARRPSLSTIDSATTQHTSATITPTSPPRGGLRPDTPPPQLDPSEFAVMQRDAKGPLYAEGGFHGWLPPGAARAQRTEEEQEREMLELAVRISLEEEQERLAEEQWLRQEGAYVSPPHSDEDSQESGETATTSAPDDTTPEEELSHPPQPTKGIMLPSPPPTHPAVRYQNVHMAPGYKSRPVDLRRASFDQSPAQGLPWSGNAAGAAPLAATDMSRRRSDLGPEMTTRFSVQSHGSNMTPFESPVAGNANGLRRLNTILLPDTSPFPLSTSPRSPSGSFRQFANSPARSRHASSTSVQSIRFEDQQPQPRPKSYHSQQSRHSRESTMLPQENAWPEDVPYILANDRLPLLQRALTVTNPDSHAPSPSPPLERLQAAPTKPTRAPPPVPAEQSNAPPTPPPTTPPPDVPTFQNQIDPQVLAASRHPVEALATATPEELAALLKRESTSTFEGRTLSLIGEVSESDSRQASGGTVQSSLRDTDLAGGPPKRVRTPEMVLIDEAREDLPSSSPAASSRASSVRSARSSPRPVLPTSISSPSIARPAPKPQRSTSTPSIAGTFGVRAGSRSPPFRGGGDSPPPLGSTAPPQAVLAQEDEPTLEEPAPSRAFGAGVRFGYPYGRPTLRTTGWLEEMDDGLGSVGPFPERVVLSSGVDAPEGGPPPAGHAFAIEASSWPGLLKLLMWYGETVIAASDADESARSDGTGCDGALSVRFGRNEVTGAPMVRLSVRIIGQSLILPDDIVSRTVDKLGNVVTPSKASHRNKGKGKGKPREEDITEFLLPDPLPLPARLSSLALNLYTLRQLASLARATQPAKDAPQALFALRTLGQSIERLGRQRIAHGRGDQAGGAGGGVENERLVTRLRERLKRFGGGGGNSSSTAQVVTADETAATSPAPPMAPTLSSSRGQGRRLVKPPPAAQRARSVGRRERVVSAGSPVPSSGLMSPTEEVDRAERAARMRREAAASRDELSWLPELRG